MIQRPWDGTFDEYLTYSLRDQERRQYSAAERKYTDSGREVYSGGGVEPDYFIAGPIEGFDPSRFGRLLAARSEFASFAERFTAEGDTRISVPGRDREIVAPGFVVGERLMNEFKEHVRRRGLTVDEGDFAADAGFIRAMIHYQVDIALFTMAEARRNLFAQDPQAQHALTLFSEAEQLLQLRRQPAVVAAAR